MENRSFAHDLMEPAFINPHGGVGATLKQ